MLGTSEKYWATLAKRLHLWRDMASKIYVMFVKQYGASAAEVVRRRFVSGTFAALRPRSLRQCLHLVTSAQPTEERLDHEFALDEMAELAEK